MTTRTLISFAVNALIIFSTIHAQDFRDEVGDKLMGRRTIPIVWPKGSRVWILSILTAWSVGLSWACDLAIPFSVPFCCLSLFVGLRFFRKRTAGADRRSYLYYNVRCSFDYKLCLNKMLTAHVPFYRYGLRLLKSRIFCTIDRDCTVALPWLFWPVATHFLSFPVSTFIRLEHGRPLITHISSAALSSCRKVYV